MLIVNFRDGTSAKLNNFIFMSGNDSVTEDTLLYKKGSYIYKMPVNKISSFEVKRFNKGRSLNYTIPLVLVVSVIFGGLIHKQVHCHHGVTECK